MQTKPGPYIENGKPLLHLSVAGFIDILGYTENIKASFRSGRGQEELVRLRNALDNAYKYLKKTEYSLTDTPRFHVRAFTDNFCIGYPILGNDGHEVALLSVIHYLGYVQAEMARSGYFIRGGIAIGELYVDDDIIFGPALLDAYESEKEAVYPRIILSKSAEAPFLEGFIRSGHKVPDVLVDSDERIFVDYLENAVMIAHPDGPLFTEFLEGHKLCVEAKLKEFAHNLKVREKYEWAARYHTAFLDMHDGLFEETLKMSEEGRPPKPRIWQA